MKLSRLHLYHPAMICLPFILGFLFSYCDDIGDSSPTWPEARNMHAAAYVGSSNEMLVFGGTSAEGENASLWSYRDGGWTLLADNGPAAREDALLVHNPDENMTYLIGGRNNASGVTYTDLWKWDGAVWTLVSATLPFGSLTHASACYDGKNKRILVFGGVRNNTLTNELWSWDGNNRTSLASEPSARLASSLVFSSANQKVYLFGGALQDGTIINDVWELDNNVWTKLNASAPAVTNSSYGVAAYGSDFLLFGGFLADRQQSSDTWIFDVQSNSWTKTTATGPSKRALHSLVFDEQSNAVLMFGGGSAGTLLDELWIFSGDEWTQVEKPQ